MSDFEHNFGGTIGRTHSESTPAWPTLPDGLNGPNVITIVLDDMGFAHPGCFGSLLNTPNMDRLAAGGIRYTGFHTTALCSPSRACLLTGRNHHAVGMRGVSNWNTGFPNMRGGITPRAATMAEILRTKGYATFAAGKWHLAPMEECSAAGPHHNWPLQKGFDRFYGFMQGETDQFYPELTRDNQHILPPRTPEQGYHLSEDLVDQSTLWIRDLISIRPDRPFFLYLAFGAQHAPHHAPDEYLHKWRGKFDEGWDVHRQRWFERQLELGVIPPNTTLSPRNPGVRPWIELTDNEKVFACRLQEAFAAMLDHTDAQIGRLLTFLEQHSILDNTMIVLLSDNGASREGGPQGVMDEFSFFNGQFEDVNEIVATRLDDIGTKNAHSNYPWGWSQVGNTPSRWYKSQTYGGGIRDSLILQWPSRITAKGEIRDQFCHITDIAPTVYDALGIEASTNVNGHEQMPMHGSSFVYTFGSNDVATKRGPQYFEMIGHRAIWADGWKAVTFHDAGTPYENDTWALYKLDEDFSEMHDLSSKFPERLSQMIDLWWAEAERNGVLPLDDRLIELFGMKPHPGSPHSRPDYTYYPPVAHIPSDASPMLSGRSWTMTAHVSVGAHQVEGVIYSRGSHNIGHTFFIKDGVLNFDYNALSKHTRVAAPISLTLGDHELAARFDRQGDGGLLTISVNGNEIGSGVVPKVMRMLGSMGMDIGCNQLSPVVSDYTPPFSFTGTINKVHFDLQGKLTQADRDAVIRAESAKE
ncbi:MAG: arylsulfatase [Ilumatobacteraceae bacterium]